MNILWLGVHFHTMQSLQVLEVAGIRQEHPMVLRNDIVAFGFENQVVVVFDIKVR